MMKFWIIACCFLLSVRGVASQPDLSVLDRKIKGWVDSGYYSGASLILMKEGRVIYEKFFGDYASTRVEYIASAGKWLAAATIAAVVDEGRLSWDDKVRKWLPAWTDKKG